MSDQTLAPTGTDSSGVDRSSIHVMIVTFVIAVAVAASAVLLSGGSPTSASAAEPGSVLSAVAGDASPPTAPDAWLDALRGSHKQLFDMPSPEGGVPLVHVMNYYDTYNRAYQVPDREVNGILTFYGATTLYGLDDATWKKYALGEFLQVKDPQTGAPATANPWKSSPQIFGAPMPQASITALQRRGATFILCNNALDFFAARVAQARGIAPSVVQADFVSGILPGVTLVPAMVIAIEKAQARGISYHRQ